MNADHSDTCNNNNMNHRRRNRRGCSTMIANIRIYISKLDINSSEISLEMEYDEYSLAIQIFHYSPILIKLGDSISKEVFVNQGKSCLFETDYMNLMYECEKIPISILLLGHLKNNNEAALLAFATYSLSEAIPQKSQEELIHCISEWGCFNAVPLLVNQDGNIVGSLKMEITLSSLGSHVGNILGIDHDVINYYLPMEKETTKVEFSSVDDKKNTDVKTKLLLSEVDGEKILSLPLSTTHSTSPHSIRQTTKQEEDRKQRIFRQENPPLLYFHQEELPQIAKDSSLIIMKIK